MPPKTVPPARNPAPLHTSEAQWRESDHWSYDHRVSEDNRVLCLGQRTMADHRPSRDEKRKCPTCLQVTGPSAL